MTENTPVDYEITTQTKLGKCVVGDCKNDALYNTGLRSAGRCSEHDGITIKDETAEAQSVIPKISAAEHNKALKVITPVNPEHIPNSLEGNPNTQHRYNRMMENKGEVSKYFKSR